MSAITRPGPAPSPAIPAPATVAGPVTQARVVRAEWTKLRGLRSTWWCALITVVLIVGLGPRSQDPGRRTRSPRAIPPPAG